MHHEKVSPTFTKLFSLKLPTEDVIKAGINSIIAPNSPCPFFFVQLPIAFAQKCAVLGGCIPQKNCGKLRRELRNLHIPLEKWAIVETEIGFVIVRTHSRTSTFASNYSAHVHVRDEGEVCPLQMFAAYIHIYLSFWITEIKRTHLKWYVY